LKVEEAETMPRKLLEQKDVTTPEAKRILERFNQEDLGEFQRRTLGYATKFSKTTPAKAEKTVRELVEKYKLDQSQAIEVVNCMPESKEELRTMLATKGKVVASEQLEEILKMLSRIAGTK
jgi:DNA-directed RNA polymerase subunit F